MGDIAEWIMDQAYEEEWYDEWLEHHDDNLPSYSKGLRIIYPYRIKDHLELREQVTWRTKDGRDILLKDITDNHLHNIIAFLRREYDYDDALEIMLEESNYRVNNSLKELKEQLNPDYYDGFY